MNAPNQSGWKPAMELSEDGMHNGPATTTGNRALMLEEPLLFEIGRADVTGVDLPPVDAGAPTRLGGLARSEAIGLVGLTECQMRVAAYFKCRGRVQRANQLEGLVGLLGVDQQSGQTLVDHFGQRCIGGPDRAERGNRGLSLVRFHLGLGQLQPGEHSVGTLQAVDLRGGLFVTGLGGIHRGLVGIGLLQLLLDLVVFPPFPSANRRQPEGNSANQCAAVAAKPFADAFTLFVFV